MAEAAAAVAKWEAMWSRDGGLQPGQAFDASAVEPAFADLLRAADPPLPREGAGGARPRALVPGCGRGYAVAELARAGYEATGLELAPTAVQAAREHLGGQPDAHVQGGDFFDFDPGAGFDLVYDCTFLCAIPPERRADWAAKIEQLLRPGGELVALIFPCFPDGPDPADAPDTAGGAGGGPPYAMSPRLVERLLAGRRLARLSLEAVPAERLARRVSRAGEFVGRWQRLPDDAPGGEAPAELGEAAGER
ncbi:unnamed protein product [Prorocentrum cordatum]|uniref:Thiol methyltransferase 2 n=1 Tax=Prorocentrum cordatum TaxID=2364126 RepID=A0ABN9P9X6_9DINO|nr:unnamed protein product [Polarella glacialis]